MNKYVGQKLKSAAEVQTAIPLRNIRPAVLMTFSVDRIIDRGGMAQTERVINQMLVQELK